MSSLLKQNMELPVLLIWLRIRSSVKGRFNACWTGSEDLAVKLCPPELIRRMAGVPMRRVSSPSTGRCSLSPMILSSICFRRDPFRILLRIWPFWRRTFFRTRKEKDCPFLTADPSVWSFFSPAISSTSPADRSVSAYTRTSLPF